MNILVRNFIQNMEDHLYQKIEKAIEKKKDITLTFDGLKDIDEDFLDKTIGLIIRNYNLQAIEHKVKFSKVSPEIVEKLKNVMKNNK